MKEEDFSHECTGKKQGILDRVAGWLDNYLSGLIMGLIIAGGLGFIGVSALNNQLNDLKSQHRQVERELEAKKQLVAQLQGEHHRVSKQLTMNELYGLLKNLPSEGMTMSDLVGLLENLQNFSSSPNELQGEQRHASQDFSLADFGALLKILWLIL